VPTIKSLDTKTNAILLRQLKGFSRNSERVCMAETDQTVPYNVDLVTAQYVLTSWKKVSRK